MIICDGFSIRKWKFTLHLIVFVLIHWTMGRNIDSQIQLFSQFIVPTVDFIESRIYYIVCCVAVDKSHKFTRY